MKHLMVPFSSFHQGALRRAPRSKGTVAVLCLPVLPSYRSIHVATVVTADLPAQIHHNDESFSRTAASAVTGVHLSPLALKLRVFLLEMMLTTTFFIFLGMLNMEQQSCYYGTSFLISCGNLQQNLSVLGNLKLRMRKGTQNSISALKMMFYGF